MSLIETVLFYLVIGAAVAAAVYLRGDFGGQSTGRITHLAATASACLFWPLYVPVLLASNTDRAANKQNASSAQKAVEDDELSAAITQVESELDTALAGLEGWAENALAKEQGRIAELRAAWKTQAQRIREIDALLNEIAASSAPGENSVTNTGRRAEQSAAARQRNLERLARVRSQAYDDLTSTLAWVRELVSMIHLARFTGAPASRAEELVAQIAAAVAGVSSVASVEDECEPSSTY